MGLNLKCKCGGLFQSNSDVEGLYCNGCGAIITGDIDMIDGITQSISLGNVFSEERAKSMRGVDCHKISIGTESKGHIDIEIPIYCSNEESRAIVDEKLDLLKYMKDKVELDGLDIYSTRGKKNVDSN